MYLVINMITNDNMHAQADQFTRVFFNEEVLHLLLTIYQAPGLLEVNRKIGF